MQLLIDSDITAYRIASACENSKWNLYGRVYDTKTKANEHADRMGVDRSEILYCPEPEARPDVLKTLNKYVDELLEPFSMYKTEFWLSSNGNFRNMVGTIKEYKGNRKDKAKPFHHQYLRDCLLRYYEARLSRPQLEVDDEIADAHRVNGATCIVSIDKDFLQLEGMHYHMVDKECSYVSREEALRNFYAQVLVGDTADNIPGIFGIGEKHVSVKKLQGMSMEKEMFNHVRDIYISRFGNYGDDFLLENIKLLYLVRDQRSYWKDYYNVSRNYWAHWQCPVEGDE